ncbi:MAG: fibronectin type III domain-containing protein [Nocardioides sp.]|nr:fibronectin type III domain-containing protein [Nocardioides sp.]
MPPLRAAARARSAVGAATVVALAASLLAVGGATSAAADRSDRAPGKSAADAPLLERPLRGPAALRRLADGTLAEAARRNGRSTEALREILEDPTTRIDPAGRVFYAEPARKEHEAPARTTAEAGTATSAPPYPLSQTFRLNSRPGSHRTLYIDVDGHTVSGTAWNDYMEWPETRTPGFVDSEEEATETQRRIVQDVWRRVAEDYAPFDINVTTQDPGDAALERTSSSDTRYGVRALVVDTTKDPTIKQVVDTYCGQYCAGMAYPDTWGELGVYAQPAFAFSDRVNNDAWQIAETVSHEVGHSFGLQHHGFTPSNGDPTDEYYFGHGAWSPIMGAGNRGLTQWSRGEYDGAARPWQDDLATIEFRRFFDFTAQRWSEAGAPLVADDHGGKPASATPLGFGSSLTASGLISSSADRDVFAFTRDCTDPLRVTATPAPVGPNLDIALRVLDPDKKTLARRNPTATQDDTVWPRVVSGLDASISVAKPRKGTHYIEVRGGRQGTASDGWTSYGSVGSYTLAVETCADAPGRPAPLRVKRGTVGAPRTLAVRWGTAEDRGAPVTGYVVRLRKVADGKVLKTARRTFGPGKRRTVWRLKPGRYRFMVRATSEAGPGVRTKWSRAKRPR